MRVLKSFCIAFSIYSKIPMPQFPWKDEDMKYTLCFFPWIGAVIGALLYLWGLFCKNYEVGSLTYTCICAAIPLIVTGGFHVDGFMDTMDAIHSYQSKERKLEILKDSHIGAFAVIMLALYGLIYISAFGEIKDVSFLQIVCMGFFLARVLSGIAIITFPHAKVDGSLAVVAGKAGKKRTIWVLVIQGLICMAFMLWISWKAVFVIVGALGAMLCYYCRCKKEFGGITGDTAGYFILLCEGSMAIMAAFACIMI